MGNSPNRHPLQRLVSPSTSLSALIHTTGIASFTYSFYYLHTNPSPINDSYGWHFQYLTILSLTLSLLTFLAGLLSDLTRFPPLFRLKTHLAITATPLSLLIGILYWTLRLWDRALVVPDWAAMPLGADLGFHLTPSVLLVLDLLLLSPPWSVSVERALGVSGAVAGLYWPWVETCARHNGFYPYPIFEAVGFWGRVGLFGGSAVVMAGCTVGLQWAYGAVNGVLNGGEPREVKGLTESSLPQAVDGLMRQGKYIAKGMKD